METLGGMKKKKKKTFPSYVVIISHCPLQSPCPKMMKFYVCKPCLTISEIAAEFPFDGVDDRLSGHFLVIAENAPQVGMTV